MISSQTVYIIEDEPEVSNALRCLFESVHLQVQVYENANKFLENYHHSHQGCLVIDVRLPGMSGLELIEHLKSQKNHLPIVVISGYADIQMAVRAMKAGAKDFILKPFNEQCLLETVQKCLTESINIESIDQIKDRLDQLSARERQIIELILDGKLNKEIAYELSISISTVEAHRASIMHKMKAKNLAQLIKLYLQAQYNYEVDKK